MKVSEYTAAFDEKYAAADAERKRFLAEGRKKEADNIKMPFWYDEVVVPMVESIATMKGKKPYIIGPCGLGAKVYITLHSPFDDESCRLYDFSEAETLMVEPEFDSIEDGLIATYLRYETGEVDTTYPEGSLGAYNGLNRVTERLPDELDEVAKLFKPVDFKPASNRKEKNEYGFDF